MKRNLIIMLAALLILAFAVPVSAAPLDTFADVPADHWAYDAVKKLAKARIVEGYGDGTFRGQSTITRYEMAIITANAMTKLDKADAQQKALIEKMANEFNAELVKLGARVAKVEAKAKVNFFFDNRLEATTTSLKPSEAGGWFGAGVDQKTQFMERIRVYMNVPVGDVWQWDSRLVQAKWNFSSDTADSVRFDRFWMTGKVFGGTLEMGKMMLYPGKGSFYGNTGDTEGAFYTAKLNDFTLRIGNARSATIPGVGTNQDLTFAELTYRPTKTMDFGVWTLQQNLSNTISDYKVRAINGAFEMSPGGLAVSFEFAKNYAKTAAYSGKSGYFVAIQSKYRATNYMPALYTSMVNPFVQGDSGWGISYRHLPSGVAGAFNRGAFNWLPLTTDKDGTWQNAFDGVNAFRIDYVTVPWKNVQWTLTYDHIKPIDGNWTNNSFQSTFNFFF